MAIELHSVTRRSVPRDSPIPRTGRPCGAAYRPMLDRVIKKLSEVGYERSFAS